MAQRFATRIKSIRANRFAFKKTIFVTFTRFARIASNLRFAIFQVPQSAIRKKGVQFGNPQAIRAHQAIRANLQINLRESGHLKPTTRSYALWGALGGLGGNPAFCTLGFCRLGSVVPPLPS